MRLFKQPEVAAAMLKLRTRAAEGRATTMTLDEACGGAAECVANMEAALLSQGAFMDTHASNIVIDHKARTDQSAPIVSCIKRS